MLTDATEGGPDGRWRLKPGIGPARDVSRFAIEVPTAFGSPNSARRQGRSRPDLSLNHRIRAARTSTRRRPRGYCAGRCRPRLPGDQRRIQAGRPAGERPQDLDAGLRRGPGPTVACRRRSPMATIICSFTWPAGRSAGTSGQTLIFSETEPSDVSPRKSTVRVAISAPSATPANPARTTPVAE